MAGAYGGATYPTPSAAINDAWYQVGWTCQSFINGGLGDGTASNTQTFDTKAPKSDILKKTSEVKDK
jgi:hypothetical protein